MLRKTEYVGTGPDNSAPRNSTVIGKKRRYFWRRMKILPDWRFDHR